MPNILELALEYVITVIGSRSQDCTFLIDLFEILEKENFETNNLFEFSSDRCNLEVSYLNYNTFAQLRRKSVGYSFSRFRNRI